MKTATLGLILLAALPCGASGKKIAGDGNVNQPNGGAVVTAQFASDALVAASVGQALSGATVNDPSAPTASSMVEDSPAIWRSGVARGSGAIQVCSVVWADAFAGRRIPTPVLAELMPRGAVVGWDGMGNSRRHAPKNGVMAA